MSNKLGFGCMRLPMNACEVDYDQFRLMIDAYMDAGFNYFDTAHGYISGKSETAIKDCLVARYPRESYILTDKLTDFCFKTESDIRPFFEKQLKLTGVEYFDYYLMHAQNRENYKKYKACKAYEIAEQLKAEGKIRHLGLSFHDKAEVLEQILEEHPAIEVVQIQFNYLDYENPSVEGRRVYEVCRKYNKDILIMEPVKGGSLVNLPDDAKKILSDLGTGASAASYALRFAASFEGVIMVLSGMSNMEQMLDNIATMSDFKPFSEEEYHAVWRVRDILNEMGGIACTDCRYCVDGCPKGILIPNLFACYNAKKQFNNWNSSMYYEINLRDSGKASDCIGCRKCEKVCPQHLPITEYLKKVAAVFEKGN